MADAIGQTKDLGEKYDYLAPDGSEIRLLPSLPAGGLAHCTLPAGRVTAAVRHRSVEEIWFVLYGQGEVWRRAGADEKVVEVFAGRSLVIPTGVDFQFRNTGDTPLQILIATLPQWPGPDEAETSSGPWSTP